MFAKESEKGTSVATLHTTTFGLDNRLRREQPSRIGGTARSLKMAAILFFAAALTAAAKAQTAPTNSLPASAQTDEVVLPEPIPDPLEAINRSLWNLNQGLLRTVIQPSSKVYKAVVRKPLRTGINHVGHNAAYPKRIVNNLLQGEWVGARDETTRFLCNSVMGIGGLFDLAGDWGIKPSEKDFGLTFSKWGWKPHVYLMLPLLGPSNDRDVVGAAGDAAVNPLTYFPPYSYVSYEFNYNRLSEGVDDYLRLTQSENDPYSVLAYAWSFAREADKVDMKVKGDQDQASLETLQSVFFTFRDREFAGKGKNLSVRIPATGCNLEYSLWLQPHKAPLVYIVPGLGSHRRSGAAIALAEMVYENGYSAVCVSSPFNPEFMEKASTAAMPAYTPVDTADLRAALGEIDRSVESGNPNRIGSRALLGYSMGGFQSLYIAANETTNGNGGPLFDRYVAIDTPVRLLHGISTLDGFFSAPRAWPAEERTEQIRNIFLKVAALTRQPFSPDTTPPFGAVESKFLVGLAFRYILRDAIYSSQSRANQGVLTQKIDPKRRAPVYKEILRYSFSDYVQKFVTPYYQGRGIDLASEGALEKVSNLRLYTDSLKNNAKVRLIENENDILLEKQDLEWLRANFDSGHMKMFETGGHLGNLGKLEVRQAIVEALGGLSPAPVPPKTKRKPDQPRKNPTLMGPG